VSRRADRRALRAEQKRLPHRARTPRHNAAIGLALVVLIAFGLVVGYTKHIPFTSRGYELKAVFANTATLRKDSPIRIAGVNVGKVLSVASKGQDAEVTFTVSDMGQPVHSDAQATIRPRLFLEGNFFIDLTPGSPSEPDLPSGGVIPVTNTATAVQLDQLLTALQAPERLNLQRLLEGYGTALTHKPTKAEDRTQDPLVQGVSAAAALNDSFRYGARAGRGTAITGEAFQGTAPHDLSGLIAAQSRIFGTLLGRESQLQDLITNFNTFAGSLAGEATNLSASIRELAPTLEQATPALRNLNAALPILRTYALEITPGVKELPATIAAGLPWLQQTNALLRQGELGGLAAELRRGAAPTAKAFKGLKGFLPQLDLTSTCVSQVLIPTGNIALNDPSFSTGQPNYREFFYNLVNLGGQGQPFDGNGSLIRVNAGGGPQLVKSGNPGGGALNTELYGNNISSPLGTQPPQQSQGEPAYRPEVPCHTSGVPALNGPASSVGSPDPAPVP
jgi:phospholipid/cholesterol/gamma-HCH transport system substrate-binding protein